MAPRLYLLWRNQRAFTLIELLVVILILAILIAIAVPSFLGHVEKAKDASAKTSLAIGYRLAKASTITATNQGQYNATTVKDAINADGGLSAVFGDCPDADASTDKEIVVDNVGPDLTGGSRLILCTGAGDKVWSLEVNPPSIPSPALSSDSPSPSSPAFTIGAAQVVVPAPGSGIWADYADWSSNDKLAFEEFGGPSEDIYTINPDGSGAAGVLTTGDNEIYPDWSPDGDRFLFVNWTTGPLYVRENGGAVNDVSGTVANPGAGGWSSDSATVFFYGDASFPNQTMYSAPADGTGSPTSLGSMYYVSGTVMDVSSTDKVAFSCDEDSPDVLGICTMDADGNNVTQVTSLSGRAIYDLAWSPDGSKIAYTVNNSDELHVMDADGSNDSVLSNDLSVGSTDLAWSPDSTALAYVRDMGGSVNDIWVIEADGTDATNVSQTPSTEDDYEPTWSPDSTTVAYTGYDVPAYDSSIIYKRQVR